MYKYMRFHCKSTAVIYNTWQKSSTTTAITSLASISQATIWKGNTWAVSDSFEQVKGEGKEEVVGRINGIIYMFLKSNSLTYISPLYNFSTDID